MNCDQAFERLTDVTSAEDAELALHLRDCPRCRAMQQTLSPAMDWLRQGDDQVAESHSPWRDSSASLLTEEAVAVAMEVSRRLPRRGRRSVMQQALGLAMVAMFGMAFGVLVLGQQRKDIPPKAAASVTVPAPASLCLWTHRDSESPNRTATSVVDSCIACHVPVMMRN